jgi:hypothetical protein
MDGDNVNGIPKATDLVVALVNDAKINQAAPSKPEFPFDSWEDIMGWPPKPTYFAKFFGPGDIAMFYGESGIGKSFIALDLIASAVSGQPFADFYYTGNDQGLKAVYASSEGVNGIPQRVKALIQIERLDHQIVQQRIKFLGWRDQIRLVNQGEGMEPNLLPKLEASAAQGFMPDILVIDTWANAIEGADENSNSEVTAILGRMKEIQQKWPNLAIVLVHHTGKGGGDARGASALRGRCDVVVKIGKDGLMECDKAPKDFERFNSIGFQLEVVDLGDGITSQVVRWIDRPQAVTWTQKANAENVLAVLEAEWKANRAPTQTEIKTALEEKGIQAAKTRTGEILGEIVKAGKAIEGQRVKSGDGRPPKTWEPPEGWTGNPGEGSE